MADMALLRAVERPEYFHLLVVGLLRRALLILLADILLGVLARQRGNRVGAIFDFHNVDSLQFAFLPLLAAQSKRFFNAKVLWLCRLVARSDFGRRYDDFGGLQEVNALQSWVALQIVVVRVDVEDFRLLLDGGRVVRPSGRRRN